MKDPENKYQALKSLLLELDGVVVAFSGGVDSTLLLAAAHESLGERVLAVTARSATYPDRELEGARDVVARIGVRHLMIETNELDDPNFRRNPADRCYFCKKKLFLALKTLALQEGLEHVVEGSNLDDQQDYRPGMEAAKELGVRAPLAEAGLSKEEIRYLSRAQGLPTWNKPALACLSSRIPYGEEITEERLKRIDQAEEAIRTLGFGQVRVRDHGTLARIEIAPEKIDLCLEPGMRSKVISALKGAGYLYVTLDMEGYRTGAMNEALKGIRSIHEQG